MRLHRQCIVTCVNKCASQSLSLKLIPHLKHETYRWCRLFECVAQTWSWFNFYLVLVGLRWHVFSEKVEAGKGIRKIWIRRKAVQSMTANQNRITEFKFFQLVRINHSFHELPLSKKLIFVEKWLKWKHDWFHC